MSGRAYARNPSGAPGGATDMGSILPHRFRLAAPKATSKAREMAIRRAIQRQCKEKNWKKLLRMRHTRLLPLETPEKQTASEPVEKHAADSAQVHENGTTEDPRHHLEEHKEKAPSNSTSDAQLVETNGREALAASSATTKTQSEQEELERSKQQLKELEEKLTTLSRDKHEKFQQLKDILIAEARAKSTPTPTKKRRLDSSTSLGMSPRLQAVAGGDASPLGVGPSLSRAQSYGGTSSVGSASDLSSQGAKHRYR